MTFNSQEEYLQACNKIIDERHKEAKWVISKTDTEERAWILKNTETSEWTFINIGDTLEIITIEESFDIKANYKGSIKTTVVDLSNKEMIRVRLPNTKGHLICENDKVFSILKPLTYEKETYNGSNLAIGIVCLLVLMILMAIVLI